MADVHILIVEDEGAIVRFLERGLAAHGHTVVSAGNGDDGLLRAADAAVDFIILDLALPQLDGREVLRRIRAARPQVPVLVLTGRDDLENKVSVLNAGADDYLTKPFAFEELLARIRAVTRRGDQPQAARLQYGDLQLDLLTRRAWWSARPIDLSSREFALLEYFMRHPGQVLSRQQILSAVWDYAFDPGSNVVDVYVRYLRRKLDRPDAPSPIETVRGAGYRLNPLTGLSSA
jgi:two-component system OmpR family response regulator